MIRPVSDALRKKAAEELNENPSTIAESIETLREWLREQPHLHSINPTDQWLVTFLRGCKYNIEKTKGKLDMYYNLKTTLPEFYSNRDPLDPGIQELLISGVVLPLNKCQNEDSPRTIISRVGPFSKTSRPLSDYLKVSFMIFEILLLEDDNTTIAGQNFITDCTELSFSLVWQWTPSMAMKSMSCAQKALSVRIKSLHIMNGPFFIAPAIRIFKMFLPTKIKNRIYAHNKDLDTLYSQIDKSILPKEYGGTNGTVQELTDYWKAKVESKREWFLENSAH